MNEVERIFESMPDKSVAIPFNNDKYCGLLVRWAEKGTGFGEFTVSCNKETGEWSVDTESMGPQWCGQMLMRLVGTTVKTRDEADSNPDGVGPIVLVNSQHEMREE